MRLTLATDPASPDRPNEDFVGVTSGAVVLLDGAGVPSGMESGCSHGVAWYARTLGSTLLAEVTQSAAPLAELLTRSIKTVVSLHDFTCDLSHPGTPSATVAMLRRTDDTLEWLVLADSVIIIDTGTAEPTVLSDDRLERTGVLHRTELDALTNGTPEHSEALRRYIEIMRCHRNREGGFWVASADPLAAARSLTGSVPAERVRSAALLSDGASRLTDLFGLATWRQLLDLLTRDGPQGLIAQVRAAEHDDPYGSNRPRHKTHDDATAALWTFR
ncbi:protein phosphatase 2C domain-containing protein [Streptosporangium sp. NPDC020145]|uniref:protein phosphatase 2C domain-containing protein n=1 Tax=Streptosporangium sp. NPDC020145 TaxID=3154694 RepID=UPI003442641D